ncbi:MAG: tetratricopeptide repeat protein [Planctomycetaceae bacterium]|nr:tetratricopeptide repeat protein [Planctomycetaceae bacterium]
MKQSIRRFIAPWMIAVLPLSGCASMNQQGSSMMPQWIAGTPKLDAKLAYGRLCERHGQTKQAHDIYQMLASTRNAPIKQSALHRLAVMSAKRGDYAEASERFVQASRVQTPSAELLNDMGYNYYLMDNLAEAESCFRKAIAMDPQYTAAQNNLGLALGQQGKFDDAMKAFAKTGNSSQAHTNMAYVYAQHRYLDQARQHYLKALGSDEKNERAAEGLIQVAKAFDDATKAQANKNAAEKSIAQSTAPAAPGKADALVAQVVEPAQPITKVAATTPSAVTPSPATTLPPAGNSAPAANSVAKTGVSTRRFETQSVSPWADQAKTVTSQTPPVSPTPIAPAPAAVASAPIVAPTPVATPVPSVKPVVAPLSQPTTTLVPELASTVSPAPVVPGVSLPKPVAKQIAAPAVVANLVPSLPAEMKWSTDRNVTAAKKTDAPQVTLGQPSSLGGNLSSTSPMNTSRTSSVTMSPSAPLLPSQRNASSVAANHGVPATVLPANPVQVASPTPQTFRSAVVTAGHSDLSPAGERGPVAGASPNAMPEQPTRLPMVKPVPVQQTPANLPSATHSPTYPTTQNSVNSAFPAAQRVGKPAPSSQALISDLVPKLPKAAEPTKVATSQPTQAPAMASDSVRQASFVDRNSVAANQSATVTDAKPTAKTLATEPDAVRFPGSITTPSVLPKGVTPTTPKLPSTPVAVAPPVLKTNTDPVATTTANRFASLKGAKEPSPTTAAPRAVSSTLAPTVPVTTVTPPNQVPVNISTPNVLPKPIHLEINGQPKTSTAATTAPAPAIPAAKSYLPTRDGYKAPAFKTPTNEVPSLTDSYRSRGLGLDGSAGS